MRRPVWLLVNVLVALTTTGSCTTAALVPAGAPTLPAMAAQPAAPPAPIDDLDRALPVDEHVRVGRLANGLTYFIRPHKKPEKRASLWLAVNAGSVLEDADQQGLAHFVEHMGFNGTKRFPKQELVNFLEGIGMQFGADLNAYTTFDETVYMLQVPTDQPDIVGKAMNVLRDWAGDISFGADAVEKERGVILEEWRLGRGAGMRLFDKQAPVLFHGSKYADRITIGKPEIIKTAPRDTIARFYRDWYRPDLMAVIAVGDFSADDIEQRIKAEFGDLPKPVAQRPRPTEPVPAHPTTLVSVETDAEMPSTSVSLYSKLPHRPERSARDYRRSVAEQLYHSMLNARLDEIRRQPDAPFLGAGSMTSKFVRPTDLFAQAAATKEDGVLRGLEALLGEALRVERHGFTATELEREKKEYLRGFRQALLERDKLEAQTFASEIVRHFLQGESMPGIAAELALVERFLPSFTLAELNGLAKSWGGAENRVIAISGSPKMTKPTPAAVLALVQSVQGRQVKAYEDAVSNVPLLASVPRAGSVKATRTIKAIGVTEWKLSNGIRVVLKPTDFKNDEVRVLAFSPGGHSLVKDADFDSARFASRILSEAGVGPLSAVQLRKALSGRIVAVHPEIDELSEGLSGSASPEDLDTLFQLIYLEITAPRRDETSFRAWQARESEQVRNRRLSPEASFFEDLQTFVAQNHRRRRPTTPEVLAGVDLDRALAVFRDRFADVGDFTFVFVGNVTPERLKPLVETYLASLPSKGRKETWRDVGVSPPSGVKAMTVAKGTEPKAQLVLLFHGTETWTRDNDNDLQMLEQALSIRLREVLREDMGGVYGVGANGWHTRRPKQQFGFVIQFGCAPENVDKLKQAVFDEIKALQDKGIGDAYLQKVKEARLRAHETSLKENNFWLRELKQSWEFGDDPLLITDIKPMVAKVTSQRIRAAAKRYLRSSEYVTGLLKPQSATSQAP